MLLFTDPGIDDAMAVMFALLRPDIELVGIVTGYGNVDLEQATENVTYLLKLAGREDVPVFAGAHFPLSGELVTFYPEFHGKGGLGPIEIPETTQDQLLNFTDLFDLIETHQNELTIIDVGRLTSLAMAYNLGGDEVMNKVNGIFLMGGAFLAPGNVTPLAEANFYGDPIAANLVMERAENLVIVPLNVTEHALVNDSMIAEVTKEGFNAFTSLLEPIYQFYADAYQQIVPEMEGAPFHDVLALLAYTNPDAFTFIKKPVSVSTAPETRGQSISDFRPVESAEFEQEVGKDHWIAMDFNYKKFAKEFIETMKTVVEEP
ncbi:nucleoside hydrolase [Alteribacter lacisalsi]|uniref:nucleoside hydrolase n=1 Tax=Alteribacter lacisalsi TaxID=2045244 RepID=UPI001F20EC40|nr:nucleoside hydrolase [Alteribacter lacisalsi]